MLYILQFVQICICIYTNSCVSNTKDVQKLCKSTYALFFLLFLPFLRATKHGPTFSFRFLVSKAVSCS